MRVNYTKVIGAGIVGTLAMTAMGVWIAPMMGIGKMNPADMLASQMGGNVLLGWMGHLMIGVALALIYAAVAASRLPGPPAIRGAAFALVPWLMAQVVVMPMMGMPLFSGSATVAGGSMLGHVVYGAVVGGIIGNSA